MKKLLTGNSAITYGVTLCRPQVVSAYPITPQTTIVEELSEICSDGRLQAKFIRVESEHSAMASAAAACAAGSRVFTATSSHGLAYMHEMLHWVSGSRLPVVMVNANRALGAPWSIWCDHSVSLSQRDTGWIQLYCQSAQEALDTVIQAYRIAEEVLLPVMVLVDAVTRLLPGVLGDDQSSTEESFSRGLLEYPQYTRPREWEGRAIPDVLLSGDHGKIAKWRHEQALALTRARRPVLPPRKRD